MHGVEVRIVDPDGDDVLAGDAGEIWVRGPNVFQGYWDDPEATAKVLTADGWLRTGDIAVTDDDGYLYIVDRAKDLIIVSGFNVYPAEVEEVIAELPGVAEVAVVGVPHPHSGEAVKAYVVLDAGRRPRRRPGHPVVRGAPGPLQVPEQGVVRRGATARDGRQDPAARPALSGPAGAPRARARPERRAAPTRRSPPGTRRTAR